MTTQHRLTRLLRRSRAFAPRLLLALLGALCLLPISAALAQSAYPERADRFVNDTARLLTDADRVAMRARQQNLLATRGVELVVVTIRSLGDYDVPERTIEDFATKLFNTWGIGDRDRDDGVLLLVAAEDRKVRIEVGSGYGAGYDAAMKRVIDDTILPPFRVGDYSQGIAAGVDGITAALEAPPAVANSAQPAPAESLGAANPAVQAGDDASNIPLYVGGAGALGALGAGAVAYRRYRRARPRTCAQCSSQMTRLDESADDLHLESGQKLEEFLGSVDYDVWRCAGCGNHSIEQYASWFSSYGRCPGCGHRTVEKRERVLVAPTYSSSGRKEIERTCRNCAYHRTDVVTLPRRTRSSSSSSGFRSGSSGRSSGGGSSSGGGASGSW
jgi:uncharacterized protein